MVLKFLLHSLKGRKCSLVMDNTANPLKDLGKIERENFDTTLEPFL